MTFTQEFFYNTFYFIVMPFIFFLLKIILLLIAVAFFTLAERKIMGACHRRFGPNEVGSWGVLQPLADGLKLVAKELVIPSKANSYLFFFAPVLILTLSLLSWVVIPFAMMSSLAVLQSEADLASPGVAAPVVDDHFIALNGPNLPPAAGLAPFVLLGEPWDTLLYLGLSIAAGMVIGKVFFPDVENNELKATSPNEMQESVSVKESCISSTSVSNSEHLELESVQSFVYAAFSLISSMSYGLLFLLSISSAMAYIMFIGSWSSASKYAFLGGLRVIAQMVSYEVSMSTTIIPNSIAAGTLNLTELVIQQQNTGWYARPLLPCLVIFLISMLAETNRAPFDLPEAESDLVSGYNTEYSSITFAMFFLGEYANMIQMGALVAILFLGGWEMGILFTLVYLFRLAAALAFKNVVTSFFFVLVRATYPRYRYDHLMTIGWTVFLPLTFAFLLFFIGILKMTDAFVYVHEIVPQLYYGGILA